jgi:hypothetical protein
MGGMDATGADFVLRVAIGYDASSYIRIAF